MLLRIGVLVTTLCVGLAGCTSDSGDEGDATDVVPSFQEYEDAVFAFRDCMAENGTPLLNLVRSIRFGTQVYNYDVPAAAVQGGADEHCYAENFAAVDMAWQAQITAYLKDHPELDPTRKALVACAARHGVDVPNGADNNGYFRALKEAGIEDIAACMTGAE